MGARRDKVLAVARYLTGHTGIPLISWDGKGIGLSSPWPYKISVSTDASLVRWRDALDPSGGKTMPIAIRYDKYVGDINDAIVAMRLSDAVKLLSLHYKTLNHGVGEDA